jgi:tRNA(Ile)-lysidine synthase
VKGDLRGIGFAHVEAVLALTETTEGHGRLQAPGLDIFRSFEWLRFGVLGEYSLETRDYAAPAAFPGVTRISHVGLELVLELLEKPETFSDLRNVYNSDGDRLDCDQLSGDLLLRNWQPGDRYRPWGASQPEKIKTFFQAARIPIWERRHWPVLLQGSEIVWSRRFGAASAFAARDGCKRVLLVRESN